MQAELPVEIAQLVGRCEVNEHTFDNDSMSVSLKFGEMLWRRVASTAAHYESQSENFMPHDIRGPMMAQAAKDLRGILRSVRDNL